MNIKRLDSSNDQRFIQMYREIVNIVLFVANETEYNVALDYICSKNISVSTFIYNNNSYHIGLIGQYLVALVKGGCIGQEAISSCEPTLDRALNTFFNAKYIITAGVCGGVKDKVNIGDVIVASEIINYESQKVNENEIIDRSHALVSQELTNLLSQLISLMNFEDFDVRYGKVLSGNKLVNNKEFAEKLTVLHPEALALDMEGYAVARFTITHRLRDWIFIKSASDNLYDKQGSKNQKYCMKRAMIVLEMLLSNSDFLFTEKPKVLVSGAFILNHNQTNNVEKFAYKLTQRLIEEKYKVINGYGQCVGNAVVASAYNMQQQFGRQDMSLQDYIEIYPFPRVTNTEITNSLNVIKNENRRLMTQGCVFAIFIYGLKDKNELSQGMNDEFQFAQQRGAFIIPLGATEYMARQLWEKVHSNFNFYFPNDDNIKNLFESLNTESDSDKLIESTIKLVNCLKNYYCF